MKVSNIMPEKNIIYVIIVALIIPVIFLVFMFNESEPLRKKEMLFFVKVRLTRRVNDVPVFAKDAVDVFNGENNELLIKKMKLGKGTMIRAREGKILLGPETIFTDKIRIVPERGKTIKVGQNRYLGEILICKDEKDFMVINNIEIEDYLKGVLPREVYSFWPFSMLKAQAIASRSFAVAEALRNKNKEYDLTCDTFSQVYAGQSSENRRTNRAVDKTRGLVLEKDNDVLPAFFHACCGGHTRNAENVWGINVESLKGVKCSWCRWSPYFRWKTRIDVDEILSSFKKAGYGFDRIDDIRAGKTDENGFLLFVRVKSRGRWYDIRTQRLRAVLGRGRVKSAKFKVKKYPRFYLFYGYGWGHGVGMCQWGAFGLSLRRWNAERILEYYYPGAEIKSIREVVK
jgi:stage II sporulation protein D